MIDEQNNTKLLEEILKKITDLNIWCRALQARISRIERNIGVLHLAEKE